MELVFKELPILGETSILASKAALAVNLIDPSKYIPFHTALFNIQGSLTEEILIDLAGKVGIDIAKFKATLKDKKVNEIIQKNSKLAQEIGIQGTPAYIIGGKLIAGGVSYEMFQKLIDDAAKDLDKVPAVPEQVQQPLAQDGPSAAPQPASPQDILATEVPDGASNNKSPEVAGVKQGAEQ